MWEYYSIVCSEDACFMDMKTAFEKQGILTFHIMHMVFAVIFLQYKYFI